MKIQLHIMLKLIVGTYSIYIFHLPAGPRFILSYTKFSRKEQLISTDLRNIAAWYTNNTFLTDAWLDMCYLYTMQRTNMRVLLLKMSCPNKYKSLLIFKFGVRGKFLSKDETIFKIV